MLRGMNWMLAGIKVVMLRGMNYMLAGIEFVMLRDLNLMLSGIKVIMLWSMNWMLAGIKDWRRLWVPVVKRLATIMALIGTLTADDSHMVADCPH